MLRLAPLDWSDPVLVGATRVIEIRADFDTPIIGWGLDLISDAPGVASVVPAIPTLGSAWSGATTSDGDGLAGLAFPTPVVGTSVLLAQVTIRANAIGTARFRLSATPGDLTEGFATISGFEQVDFGAPLEFIVPAPGGWMAGSLFGATWLRRRRRSPDLSL